MESDRNFKKMRAFLGNTIEIRDAYLNFCVTLFLE